MTGHRTVLDDVPGLRALAIAQDGVVRRDQLLELGVTRFHVRTHLAAGRWRAVGPNVIVLTTGQLTRGQEMVVGQLHVGPSGALAGWTALEREGLAGWDRPGVHVVVPHGANPPRLPGLEVHQSRTLDAVDLGPGRLRSVTAARAAIDAAGWLPSARAASGLVLAVAQQRLATPDQMLDVLRRVWRVRHTAVLRDVLEEAVGGSDSRAEGDLRRILRSVGFGDVRQQVPIETPAGPVRADLGVRLAGGRMLLIEVDGPSHDDPRRRAADAERDASLVALGYVVLRLPAALIRTDPEAVRRQLRTIWMAQRAA